MRALSVRQPWAWLITHAGKDIENRDWKEGYPGLWDARHLARLRDYFLIHTGKGMTRDEYEDALMFAKSISLTNPFPEGLTLPEFADLPRGGIVGIARLVEVVTIHRSPWFFGPFGLVLAEAAPLPFRPLKGALGFFDAPPEFEAMRKGGVWQWSGPLR